MTAQAPERCNGTRILSYINWEPFAPATHKACPGCPDCQPKPSEGKQFVVSPMMRIAELEATIERQAGEITQHKNYARDMERSQQNMRTEYVDRVLQLEADLAAARLNERRYLWLRSGDQFLDVRDVAGSPFFGVGLDVAIDRDLAAGDGK